MGTESHNAVVVEYNSDPTKMIDDHDSEDVYLTEINNRRFNNIFDAIRFISECRSPITSITELLPTLRSKNLKPILPDRNIKIKHQANDSIDSMFDLDAEDWG
jgi:hypothetical protein